MKFLTLSSFWSEISFINFSLIISAANILMYIFTALIVFVLRKYLIQFDLNFENQATSKKEMILSLLVVFTNILVGLIGFACLKNGIIDLVNKSTLFVLLDFFILFFFIDFGMYFSHLFVHKTVLYRWLHKDHHAHESMSLLSLYVMHPFEAFGFGLILITLLCLYTIDTTALLTFLFFNWIMGVFAHSGIEPSEGKWGNYICMTRFHQIHHESPNSNFGFFTPLMDMLFKTRNYQLKKNFKLS